MWSKNILHQIILKQQLKILRNTAIACHYSLSVINSNDLYRDNLELLEAGDYDGDGLQETYFRLKDDIAVLHAYMHADGNIQYANYQSASDLEQYMIDHAIDELIWSDWL